MSSFIGNILVFRETPRSPAQPKWTKILKILQCLLKNHYLMEWSLNSIDWKKTLILDLRKSHIFYWKYYSPFFKPTVAIREPEFIFCCNSNPPTPRYRNILAQKLFLTSRFLPDHLLDRTDGDSKKFTLQ